MANEPKVELASKPVPQSSGTAGSEISNMVGDLMSMELAPRVPTPAALAPTHTPTPAQAPQETPPVQPALPVADKPAAAVPEGKSLIPADVLPGSAAPVAPAASEDEAESDLDPTPDSVKRDPKADKAWQSIKQAKRELAKQLKAKDAEIERLTKNQTPDLEEVLTLKNQIAEYESKLSQYDLAETREFKEKFDSRMGSTLQKGVSVLVRAGKTPEEARGMMLELVDGNKSMQQINDAIANEPYAIQGALVNLVTEFDEISKARGEALKNWKETQAALKVQSKRDSEIRLMENVERETEVAVQNVIKAGNWMYTKSADSPEWNEQVDTRIKAVKGILRSGKPEDLVALVMEGITAADTRMMAVAQHTQIQELQAKLQKLVQAGPRLGAGATPPAGSPPADGKPRDPNAVIGDLFSGQSRDVRIGRG